MNEPKRRGRPPKAKLLQPTEPTKEGCAECGQAVGHYDDCGAGMGVVKDDGSEFMRRKAQGFASRVYASQSPSLPHKERLARVAKALERQGLSMDGVKL